MNLVSLDYKVDETSHRHFYLWDVSTKFGWNPVPLRGGDAFTPLSLLIGILPQGNIIRYTVNIKEALLDIDVLNNGKELYQLEQQVFLRVKKDFCINL